MKRTHKPPHPTSLNTEPLSSPELLYKNRALNLLKHCNQALFHSKKEQELLTEICRIAVEDAGYLLAWIGYPKEDKQKTIKPMAHCGYEEGYLESLSFSWADTKHGHGPAGMAIRNNKPYIVRDVHSEPNFIPWREAAIERGYVSVAAFPLYIKGQQPAVILMYSAEVGTFNTDEVALLLHFSETLSYGIESMRLKEKNLAAEQSLRDSEQRFQYMLDTSPIAVRIAKKNGDTIVYANSTYNRLMNTNAEHVIGVNPSDFYTDKNEYQTITHELQRGVTVYNRLVKLSVPSQGIKWALSTYLPVNFEGEDAVLAWFYDITEQKLNNDALQLSEEEYIKAFKSIPEGLSITTIDNGTFMEVNQGCINLLGYERSELIGHTSLELKLWPNTKHRDKLMKEVEINGSFDDLEVSFRTKSGRICDVLISGETITINQQPCIILSARDITERKQIQNELHQLRNYLANIIDSMPSVIIGVDSKAHVTQWNDEAYRITGVSTKDAQGQLVSKVFPRLTSEMTRIFDAIKTRQKLTESHKSYIRNSDIHYEDITIYPLIANGVEGAVVRLDDVTERIHLEEMMIQSEKMLSVGGLAAGMAHEINNPLAGIMQSATVMASRLTNKLLPANVAAAETIGIDLNSLYDYMDNRGILRMLSAISESSLRIADIIDNMLTFARKSDAVSLPCNLATLLDKSLALATTDYDLKKQYDFKAIKIIKEYQSGIPNIPCEASKLQQVFLNLFRNGAQAMQMLNTKEPTFILRIHFQENDDMVCIEIEDNGPGMDEKTYKRIFEPFFTTKPEGIGTGLGLSVSYFIITENHGGEMTVTSELGKGSLFTIRLPLQQTEPLDDKQARH